MSFQISGLPRTDFEALFALSDAGLAARDARRMIVDRKPGFPCRVSLADAELGETVLLVNYEHLPVASPFRSRYAVYVRENAAAARLAPGEVPAVLRSRLLAVRSFDDAGMLLDAQITEGVALEAVLHRALEPDTVAYLHLHFAKPGCFAARVDRMPAAPTSS